MAHGFLKFPFYESILTFDDNDIFHALPMENRATVFFEIIQRKDAKLKNRDSSNRKTNSLCCFTSIIASATRFLSAEISTSRHSASD